MLNRREFIGAAFGVALAARAAALPADQFRWAMSSHMFTPLKPHPESRHQDGGPVRVPRNRAVGRMNCSCYLKQPPEVFKKVLDEAGISISSVASGGEYYDSATLQAMLDSHSANAKFGAYFGIKALKANLSRRLGQEDLSSGNARILASNLNEVGKRTIEHGVKFAFHPHAWTMAERNAEVAMILEMTDPKLVFVTLDTCHASVGGFDPVTFAKTTTRGSRISISRTRCPSGAPAKDGAARRRARKRRQRWRRNSACRRRLTRSISGWVPAAWISRR